MGRTVAQNTADHRYAAASLSDYIDGRLSEAEAQRVRLHVKACAVCQQDLASLRATVALLHRAPMRAVPRSFALPASAQRQQATQRRWNATYAFMRGGMLAVAAMLVITLGVDVAFRRGLISLSQPASSVAKSAEAMPEAEGTEVVVLVEKQVAAPQHTPEAAQSQPTTVAAVSAPEATAAPDATAPETPLLGLAAQESAPNVTVPAPAPAEGEAARSAQPTAQAEAGTAPVQPSADSSAEQVVAMAPAAPTAEPTVAAAAARAEEPASTDEAPQAREGAWALWEATRTALGLLLGLLLILCAGLLWSAQKRRL